ncbi:hypothetical protein FQZ97_751810 [compost metagenome]
MVEITTAHQYGTMLSGWRHQRLELPRKSAHVAQSTAESHCFLPILQRDAALSSQRAYGVVQIEHDRGMFHGVAACQARSRSNRLAKCRASRRSNGLRT